MTRDTRPCGGFFDYFAWLPRKMVRIGMIGLALCDPHFCILSRDCFNLSREYFSLWVIKTSLDRNASAVLERKCYFHASSSFSLSSLLQTTGRYFSKICAIHQLNRLVYMLKSCCESSLSENIGQCYFLLLQVYCLSSSLKEVFLARHAIFCFDHNSRT